MSSIFVSIASYRDPLLSRTIEDLFDKKSGKNDIIVGVFEQTALQDSLEVKNPSLINRDNVRYIRVDPENSRGVGWARYNNSLQVHDEDFFFQIDSHMLFDRNWDSYLINDWNLGRQKHGDNKTIISTSCKGFDLDESGNVIDAGFDYQPITAILKCFTQDAFHNIPFVHGEIIESTPDIFPAIHVCAGNFFSHSDWVREVGPDPMMYFVGEEHKIVLSSFFAGYHLYHPTRIISYHYNRSADYITKPWCKPLLITEGQYADFTNSSREHWLHYLENLGEKKLNEFYKYSGIDYVNKCFDDRVRSYLIKVLPPVELANQKSPWAEE
jgi:hypothetical protein